VVSVVWACAGVASRPLQNTRPLPSAPVLYHIDEGVEDLAESVGSAGSLRAREMELQAVPLCIAEAGGVRFSRARYVTEPLR
jgi:hypothetical protein